MNDMNPVGWFEICVQDMARAKAFYERVFDVLLIELDGLDGEMWAFPMHAGRYGAAGALVRMPDRLSGAGSTLVYFSCADCAVEKRRRRQAPGASCRRRSSPRAARPYRAGV